MNLHKPAMTISFGLFLHNVGFSIDYHFSLNNNIIGMVINIVVMYDVRLEGNLLMYGIPWLIQVFEKEGACSYAIFKTTHI